MSGTPEGEEEGAEQAESAYLATLEHERHMYAWCLVRLRGLGRDVAEAQAAEVYGYRAPTQPDQRADPRVRFFNIDAWQRATAGIAAGAEVLGEYRAESQRLIDERSAATFEPFAPTWRSLLPSWVEASKSPEEEEAWYARSLEHERHMYAWCLERHGGRSPEAATARALAFYEREPLEAWNRCLVFHEEAWHWAMLEIFEGQPYWKIRPELERPSAEYRAESERFDAGR